MVGVVKFRINVVTVKGVSEKVRVCCTYHRFDLRSIESATVMTTIIALPPIQLGDLRDVNVLLQPLERLRSTQNTDLFLGVFVYHRFDDLPQYRKPHGCIDNENHVRTLGVVGIGIANCRAHIGEIIPR